MVFKWFLWIYEVNYVVCIFGILTVIATFQIVFGLKTQCKIEFTYQSQKTLNFTVLSEWQKWFLTPNVINIIG